MQALLGGEHGGWAVWGIGAGDHADVDVQPFGDFQGGAEVAEVDRIEGAAVDAEELGLGF